MSNEPNFERFRSTLLLETEPDRVPLFDFVDLPIMERFLGKKVGLTEYIEFQIKAGYDWMATSCGYQRTLYPSVLGSRGDSEGFFRKPTASWRERAFKSTVTTDFAREWAEEGEGIITTMEDFKNFPWPKVEDFDYSLYDEIKKILPQGMKVLASEARLFCLVHMLMGFETFCKSLRQNLELVEAMFEKIGTLSYQTLNIATKFDSVGGVIFADDIAFKTGTMISPKHLRQYVFPWFRRFTDLCKERGKPSIYHSDGNLYQVLDDLVDCGFNGLNPIEPVMDIAYVKERVGHKMCLVGGVSVDVLSRRTPEEVEILTKEILRKAAPGGGLIIGASNSVPDYVPIENYNAMRETALKHGIYPISMED